MPDISRLVIEVDSKGVLEATGDLKAFEGIVGKAGKTTDDTAKKMGAFQLVANKLPGPLKSIASGLMGLVDPATAVVSAFLEIGAAAAKYVKESIDAFAKFETLKVNLEVVMGSASAASDMFNQLSRMSGRTPFNVEQLAEVATLLKTAGINAKDLIPTLETLGNVSGGSIEKFNRIAYNFAQVAATGKATSMDIKQFQQAGMPIAKMLEDIGKAGDTSFEAISEAIKQATSEGGMFYGAMEKGAETLSSMRTNLEGLREQYKALMAEEKGWSDFEKGINSGKTGYYKAAIEYITLVKEMKANIEKLDSANIEEKLSAIQFFQNTSSEEILDAAARVRINIGKETIPLSDIYGQRWKGLQSEKSILEGIISQEKIRTREIERQLALINEIKSAYNSTMEGVNEIWAKTTQGQIEIIEEEINKLLGFKETNQKVVTIPQINPQTGMWGPKEVISELSSQDKARIDTAINYWRKKIEELKDKNDIADWAKILAQATGYAAEDVSSWRGLKTVENYATEAVEAVRDRFLAESPEHGFIYEALGLNKSDVYQNAAQQMRSLLQIMTEARLKGEPWSINDESYNKVLELVKQWNAMADNSRFDEEFEKRKEELELLIKAGEEWQKLREYTKRYGSEERAQKIIDLETKYDKDKNFNKLEKELELRLELIWADEEERKIREYIEQGFDEDQAKKLYALEKQIEKTEALRDALNSLKEAGLNLAAGGLVEFARDLGKALHDGVDFSEAFEGAIWNMLKSLIDAMPQLLLNVGLQLITAGQWGPGLAFIGASGLMGFVSGLIDDANDNGRNDEEERLRKIQQQITDLIDQQRKQQEYYVTQKRKINDSAVKVNDAIITPRGTVYTNPEDYIIATKRPDTLMGGSGGNVYITVNNKTSASVSAEQEALDDGTKLITITVDQIVQRGIAGGKYDNAFSAMNSRRHGRGITN